jgi:hypothetical protein
MVLDFTEGRKLQILLCKAVEMRLLVPKPEKVHL